MIRLIAQFPQVYTINDNKTDNLAEACDRHSVMREGVLACYRVLDCAGFPLPVPSLGSPDVEGAGGGEGPEGGAENCCLKTRIWIAELVRV